MLIVFFVLNRYLDEFYASKIFQLEEAKFRCELCCKLFRGAEFVKKHLHNKHPTEVENIKQRVCVLFYFFIQCVFFQYSSHIASCYTTELFFSV